MDSLLQLGVGGMFGILVIREVLTFLKTRRAAPTETTGEKSVEYWHLSISKIVTDAIGSSILPVLERQTQILGEMSRILARAELLLEEASKREQLR